MNFSIVRKFFTNDYVISELYINGKLFTYIRENIKGGNITNVLPNGRYEIKQFFSARRKRIVYGLKQPNTGISQEDKYIIIQKGGDFNSIRDIKFPYLFSQMKYNLNIS